MSRAQSNSTTVNLYAVNSRIIEDGIILANILRDLTAFKYIKYTSYF